MRRDKVVALPRRGAAEQRQRKARQGPPPAARAAADLLAAERGPRAIDEATYQDHAAKIREQFRVAVDCPDLTYLASRWGPGRFEHLSALRRIAPDFAVLLARQQAEREEFLHRPVPGMPRRRYADLAALVKRQYPDAYAPLKGLPLSPPRPAFLISSPVRVGEATRQVSDAIAFDINRERYEAEAASLVAWLRAVPPEKPTRKTADTILITRARAVADWSKQHGKTGRADWQATVMIMECHGWDLPGRSLSEKAQRLEDRVTRDARRRSRGTVREE